MTGRLGAAALIAVAVASTAGIGVGSAAPAGPDVSTGPDVSLETVGVGPVQSTRDGALPYAQLFPDAAPAGANDFSCVPTPDHPNPVVLVHGTYGSAYGSFASMSPALAAEGYCVFALNYGEDTTSIAGALQRRGVGPVARSADELRDFVDGVLARTGADKVDIVGHSQGSLVTRQYLRFGGGAAKVGEVISLAGSNHGTTVGGLGRLVDEVRAAGVDPDGAIRAVLGSASVDQLASPSTGSESAFLAALDEGGDTEPGIDYTAVATTTDTVVTPWQTSLLVAGPGAEVDNIVLQDRYPGETVGHSSVPYSPRVLDIVIAALRE